LKELDEELAEGQDWTVKSNADTKSLMSVMSRTNASQMSQRTKLSVLSYTSRTKSVPRAGTGLMLHQGDLLAEVKEENIQELKGEKMKLGKNNFTIDNDGTKSMVSRKSGIKERISTASHTTASMKSKMSKSMLDEQRSKLR
jgi:hypothetical protein